MTKEEILAMEAGGELDELVAIQVMGELKPVVIPENALELQLAGSSVRSPEGSWLCLCKYDEGDIPTWRPLHYSTDISSAWQVVEKMREELFSNRRRFLNALQEQTKHTVAGTGKECLVAWPDVFWSTTPEAICKAALLVKYS